MPGVADCDARQPTTPWSGSRAVHLNSRLVFERHAVGFIESGQRVLEIGPDKKPSTYQSLVTASDVEWTTVDLVYDSNRGRRYSSDGSGVDYAITEPILASFSRRELRHRGLGTSTRTCTAGVGLVRRDRSGL
jgi:hypothetical protein